MTYLILHSSTKSKAFDWPMSAKIIPRIGETIAIEGKYYTVFDVQHRFADIGYLMPLEVKISAKLRD